MGIALTIGIMLILIGFFDLMRDIGPVTFLDDFSGILYMVLGVIVLINCFIHAIIAGGST